MATKKRIDSSKTWRFRPTSGGSEGPWQTVYRESDSSCTAVFSRVRPPYLTPTVMSVVKNRYNEAGFSAPGWEGELPLYRSQVSTTSGFYTSTPSSSELDSLQILAGSRFVADKMDLGETLGGARQSVRMVAKRLTDLHDLFRDVKKYGWRKAFESRQLDSSKLTNSRKLASGYLEGIFGWLPLIQDIHDALVKLHDFDTLGSTVSRKASRQLAGVEGGRGGFAKVTLGGRVSNRQLRTLSQLGLSNPALTAWQLLPWSFVLDWAVNASQTMAYFTWKTGLSETWGCRTSCSRTSNWCTLRPTLGGGRVSWLETSRITRSVFTNPSIPWNGIFADRGISISVSKGVTAAALLRSLF